MLSAEEALNNADRIKDQALRILSAADTHVAYNHEWLARVPLSDFFKMLSTFTVPQMLARESFQARLGSAQPLSLPELLYPLLQGIDSVCLRAEIEIGGRDQIPNFHLTRRLQSALGMEPQIAIILPLLPGTDGAEKMSASAGNDIPLDTTPEDMYGKVMSVPDTALAGFAPFARLLDRNDPNDRWPCDTHPMMAKAELARRMITRIYGPDAALRAHADFDCRFRKRNIPDELLEVEVPVPRSERALPLFQVLVPILAKTRAEARRLVEQGAIRIDGQRIMDPLFSMPVGTVSVISRSHRAHVRVTLIGCTT
jgi:tyrosyl-tRNA synthetase